MIKKLSLLIKSLGYLCYRKFILRFKKERQGRAPRRTPRLSYFLSLSKRGDCGVSNPERSAGVS